MQLIFVTKSVVLSAVETLGPVVDEPDEPVDGGEGDDVEEDHHVPWQVLLEEVEVVHIWIVLLCCENLVFLIRIFVGKFLDISMSLPIVSMNLSTSWVRLLCSPSSCEE